MRSATSEKQEKAKEQSLSGFAKRIAGLLRKAHQSGDFERLVLVAGPAMLGELHKQLDDETDACITAEFSKDLPVSTPEEVIKLLDA